jgi:hypothetical protein
MANEIRKPKIGDLVKAIGHQGSFHVMKVDDKTRTADIQLIQTGQIFHYAPWMALSYATARPKPQN